MGTLDVARFGVVALVGVAALLGGGCDRSGIPPLGSPRDVTSSCARSTWIRSTDTGTELFLFGVDDPTVPSAIDPDTQGRVASCFVHIVVGRETSTTIEQGEYVLDSDGVGTFDVDASYQYVYQPEETTATRLGSRRDDSPEPASHAIGVAPHDDRIRVTFDGEPRLVTNLADVIGRVDPTTQAGAEVIFGLYNVPLFTSFARLLSFQAAAMSTYWNNEVTYQALASGYYTILVEDALKAPHNILIYYAFEDLNGMVINGRQDTHITPPLLQADGTMAGILEIDMRGRKNGEEFVLNGSIDYGGLIVDNGIAGDGVYTVALEGYGEYTISWDLGDVIDLRSILPVAEGQP